MNNAYYLSGYIWIMHIIEVAIYKLRTLLK